MGCVDDKLMHVFLTMAAKGDMTQFAWLHHIEELRAAVTQAVADKDWGQVHVYGPDTEGFGLPAICVELQLTPAALGDLLEYLADQAWIDVPVYVYPAIGRPANGPTA